MKKFKLSEVFVVGGQPSYTYFPREKLGLEVQLKDYHDTGYKCSQ